VSSSTRNFDIEGQRLGYPTQFRDGSSATGLFVVPARAANALIAESGFEVATIAPGKGLFALLCVHYADSDCGVYNEIAMAFFVKTFGCRPALTYLRSWIDIVTGRAAIHIWRLPVTSKLARDAGIFMWGFPKTIEEIDFEIKEQRAQFTLRMQGEEVIRYSVRADGRRHQPPKTSPVYSVFEGAPHVGYLTQEYREMGIRLGDGRLWLGDHHVAEELRGLGLPRRPLLSTWMGHLRFEMSAPEKL